MLLIPFTYSALLKKARKPYHLHFGNDGNNNSNESILFIIWFYHQDQDEVIFWPYEKGYEEPYEI